MERIRPTNRVDPVFVLLCPFAMGVEEMNAALQKVRQDQDNEFQKEAFQQNY